MANIGPNMANKKKGQKLAIYTAYIWPIYGLYTAYTLPISRLCRPIFDTVDSQPKVNGTKVKTLGPVDVKIIRSKPSILGWTIGRNL